MPERRSSVQRGMNDQRDRGRRKKHHKARTPTLDDSSWDARLQEFCNWLETNYSTADRPDVALVQTLSLKRFLQASPMLDMSPGEKLRQLAIFLEPECESLSQPKGWKVLRRIYQEAIKYDRGWPYHYHSMSLSLLSCSDGLEEEDDVREVLLNESLDVCRSGLATAGENASLYSTLGRTHYELRQLEEALDTYQTAVNLDPDYVWAVLYKAHCLHDLKRWSEAITAYEAVNISAFDGPKSWRGVLVRDQLAICRLYAGDESRAAAEFEAALYRYESNPGLLYSPQYLIEAANGVLDGRIGVRVDALLKSEGWPNRASAS